MAESDRELSYDDKRDLVIQAAIQAIPYVGGSFATLYFGRKQELRFKRLESFYQEVAGEMNEIKDNIASTEAHDKEALLAIIEELNEKIEQENVAEKREYFKSFLKNSIIDPVTKENYDERHFFLNLLGMISMLECELLLFLVIKNEPVRVGSIQKDGIDQYAIVGAIGRLKTYGFLVSGQYGINIGGSEDNSLIESVSVSEYGKRFYDFCLEL